MSALDPFEAMSTPLVSSRTLLSVTASANGSTTGRVPLAQRRSSLSGGDSGLGSSSIPMSVGRLSTMRSANTLATPSTSSRLPRPSSALGSAAIDFDAPPSTARRVASLKRTSSIAGLSQDADQVSSLKRQLHRTQTELEELRLTHSRHVLESTTTERKLSTQLEEHATRLDRLSREKVILVAEKREAEEKDSKKREEEDRMRREAEGRERLARKELSEVHDRLRDVEARLRQKEFDERQAREKVGAAESRDKLLMDEVERLRRDLDAKEAQLGDERQARAKAEEEAEKVKVDRHSNGESSAASTVIREELHRQVSHLKTLEKENQRMAKRLETFERQHVNVEVVKEANKALEKRVKTMDELVKKVAEQESEIEALRRERKDWSAFLTPSDTSEFSSPRKITRTLAATRIENATFRQKVEQHALGLRSRDQIIGELEEQVASLSREIEAGKQAVLRAEARAKQEEGQTRLLQQEVDLLKRHLDSYNTEEAVQQAGNYDAQRMARVQELEELLEAHKKEIHDLAEQVRHWQGLVERHGGSTTKIFDRQAGGESTGVVTSKHLEEQLRANEALREEFDELKNAHELLEREVETLEDQIESLEQDHGIRGAYNSETTRVLEFRDSPDRIEHAIRTSTLELLRNENAALIQRISDLCSSSSSSSSTSTQALIPLESLRTAESTIASLRASVQQKETMLKRISSAMAGKTESLRLAIQDLLGFQLAFLDSGRIRITSLYAPSKDRSLAFDPWPGGPMPYKLVSASDEQVMRNDEVRRSVAFWLESRRSLPGFLASLTMTLYEETTRGAAGGVVYG